MAKLTGSLVKYPARASFIWYLVATALGAILLALPISHGSTDRPLSILDAIFTSTSAACVTGLAVRSTEFDFSWVGQIVILLLLQLGGIGIMTVTTFIVVNVGSQASLRQRLAMAETLGVRHRQDLRWIITNVLWITFLFESAGFVLLAIRGWMLAPGWRSVWQALFHSVSAFCNAGFSLHDDSLTRYQGDPWVNLVVCALIIAGGLGFPVIIDIQMHWKGRWGDRWDHLHLHTKLMLIGTIFLIVSGLCSFLIVEWNGVLASMPFYMRPLAALFHSVSCRTAGFNTVDMSALSNAGKFISILLMIVGAGPCSTGGGSKVSTMMVLLLYSWSTFMGRTTVSCFRRTIPRKTVARAIATVMLFGAIVALALTTMLVLEQSAWRVRGQEDARFVDALFEIVSALGTVGLSTGITSHLGAASRWILIVLMFCGRLGPISVFAALSRSERKDPIEHPPEEPMIG